MLYQHEHDKALKSLIDLSRSFWKSKILLVANELDVFSKLSHSPKTAKDLSRIIKTDPRATELLINALAAMGFLKKEKDYFSNTEVSKKYLCQGSPSYIGFALRHYNYCWDAWSELEQAVKRGHPKRFLEQEALHKDEKRARDFTLKMDFTGWKMAEEIEQMVDLSNVKSMLDLGGGSGCYSIYFAKKYPQLHCTIFELPFVAKVAEENVIRHNLEERVSVVTGDFTIDPIKDVYDLVLVSFVPHGFGEKEVHLMFNKVHSILKKDGRLVVQDYLLSSQDSSCEELAVFNMHMFLVTSGGRVYTLSEIKNFFYKANFSILQVLRLSERSDFLMGREPYLFIGGVNHEKK